MQAWSVYYLCFACLKIACHRQYSKSNHPCIAPREGGVGVSLFLYQRSAAKSALIDHRSTGLTGWWSLFHRFTLPFAFSHSVWHFYYHPHHHNHVHQLLYSTKHIKMPMSLLEERKNRERRRRRRNRHIQLLTHRPMHFFRGQSTVGGSAPCSRQGSLWQWWLTLSPQC